MAKTMTKKPYILATGRRKKSIARVRILENGTGKVEINGVNIDEYFKSDILKQIVNAPIALTGLNGKLDVFVTAQGGGLSGQAGAIRHGIARAIDKMNASFHTELKTAGYLTRDPRAKERKKYGLKKARKAPQFSKR